MSALAVDRIAKRFGAIAVLNDISLDVAPGEFMVLLGPSGCGKSTLLNTVAGLEEADAGRIFIGGDDVTKREPRDRNIAMVFQSYALYPTMSVRRNMAFGLRMRGTPRAEADRLVEDAARLLQIDALLDRRPGQLSGGQRQRVAIGRAIVRQPKIFLFDEPLSNLDAKLRAEMRIELKELHRRLGATIIYVTHDQVEAMTMADRIFIMNKGVLQQSGTPMDVYSNPANRFVAGFIGSPAMNFIDAKAVEADGGLFIDAGDFRVKVPESFRARLQPYAGRPIAFGVRPEDIAAHNGGGDGNTLVTRAEVVETLGSEIFAHLTCGEQSMVARMDVPERPLRVGETLKVDLRMAKTHVFDSETSQTII
jgi:multiple sugar transport system ATP-binding protein